MIKKISNYELIIFDSDGVILNSNKIKEDSFVKLFREYEISISEKEIRHVIKNYKGKSRYEIINEILQREKIKNRGNNQLYEKIILRYSEIIKEQLLICEASQKIELFRSINDSSWLVLTAGDQKETIEIYKQRKIYNLFDLGIMGAPRLKKENLKYLANSYENILLKKILYIGDSINDLILAKEFNFDFILINDWSSCYQIKNKKFSSRTAIYSTLDSFISNSVY